MFVSRQWMTSTARLTPTKTTLKASQSMILPKIVPLVQSFDRMECFLERKGADDTSSSKRSQRVNNRRAIGYRHLGPASLRTHFGRRLILSWPSGSNYTEKQNSHSLRLFHSFFAMLETSKRRIKSYSTCMVVYWPPFASKCVRRTSLAAK